MILKTTHRRFWEKVSLGKNGCWDFNGCIHKTGYGQFFKTSKQSVYAHRFAYQDICCEIPSGLFLDHLCRNRSCVNPAHLEPVTNKENCLRGIGPTAINAKKTHCSRGHELGGENLIILSDGRRDCRSCVRIRMIRGIEARRQRNLAKRC